MPPGPDLPAAEAEPIYQLAEECEELFESGILRLKSLKYKTYRLVEECQQRFVAWTRYLGVLAKRNVCLDYRLRHHPDLQDLVLRLLDILRINLLQLGDFPYSGERDIILLEGQESGTSIIENVLSALDGAIDRLNRLGITIRQSSVRSVLAGGPSDIVGYNSFKELALVYVRTLYPDASTSLHDHLSKSMASRYDRIITRQVRQSQLQTRRIKPSITLPLIAEDVEMSGTSENTVPGSSFEPGKDRMAEGDRESKVFKRVNDLRSDASSINRSILDRKIGSPSQASSVKKKETSSIQINLIGYPKPPQASDDSNYATCEWCFETRKKSEFEGDEWRKHVDRDLKPYVCISEKCSGSYEPASFTTFKTWNEHMLVQHGSAWHQEVQPSSAWVCAVCNDSSTSFRTPQALYTHMEDTHQFTDDQLEAIVPQSKIQVRRQPETCPLCCFRVEEDPKATSELPKPRPVEEVEHGKRHRGPASPESSRKRTRTNIDLGNPDRGTIVGLEAGRISGEGDTSGATKYRSTPSRQALMARHVAIHLQGLMDLSIRLIKVHDSNAEALSQGSSVDEGDNSTRKRLTASDEEGSQTDHASGMSTPDDRIIGYESEVVHPADYIPDTSIGDVATAWAEVLESTASRLDPDLPTVQEDNVEQILCNLDRAVQLDLREEARKRLFQRMTYWDDIRIDECGELLLYGTHEMMMPETTLTCEIYLFGSVLLCCRPPVRWTEGKSNMTHPSTLENMEKGPSLVLEARVHMDDAYTTASLFADSASHIIEFQYDRNSLKQMSINFDSTEEMQLWLRTINEQQRTYARKTNTPGDELPLRPLAGLRHETPEPLLQAPVALPISSERSQAGELDVNSRMVELKITVESSQGGISEQIISVPPNFTYMRLCDFASQHFRDCHWKIEYQDGQSWRAIECDEDMLAVFLK